MYLEMLEYLITNFIKMTGTHQFKGYYTPNLKLACFVLYLKIIITFLEK